MPEQLIKHTTGERCVVDRQELQEQLVEPVVCGQRNLTRREGLLAL